MKTSPACSSARERRIAWLQALYIIWQWKRQHPEAAMRKRKRNKELLVLTAISAAIAGVMLYLLLGGTIR